MGQLMPLYCQKTNNEKILKNLEQAIQDGYWVQLLPPYGDKELIATNFLPKGSGVVVASGGSSGGRQYCLQPSIHLDQSAADTGDWLQKEGIVPQNCLIFNPLPLYHVSGLMPWWRSKCWGAEHVPVSQLLHFVYDQINTLLSKFNTQPIRAKREENKQMDCKAFLNVLSIYEKLQLLTSTPQTIKDNKQEIEKISNDIQMYSTFDGISRKSCENMNQSIINEKVQATQSSLGR